MSVSTCIIFQRAKLWRKFWTYHLIGLNIKFHFNRLGSNFIVFVRFIRSFLFFSILCLFSFIFLCWRLSFLLSRTSKCGCLIIVPTVSLFWYNMYSNFSTFCYRSVKPAFMVFWFMCSSTYHTLYRFFFTILKSFMANIWAG